MACRDFQLVSSAAHLCHAGSSRTAVDGCAAVVHQASCCASRVATDAALANESGLLARPRALRSYGRSPAARDGKAARQSVDCSRAAGIGAAVAAIAGALPRLTVAQRAAACDRVVAELRADIVESSIQVLVAAGFRHGEEIELWGTRQIRRAD